MVVADLVSYQTTARTRHDRADHQDMAAVAEVTAVKVVTEAVAHVVALTVPHRKAGTVEVMVDMAATAEPHKKNHNTAVARNTDIPVLDKPDNQDARVAPVGLTKLENPALLVLPKENGLSDHYGRKEANCVENAPKAG